MSSTDPVVSLVGLPPEIRFIIWRLSLPPRVVEICASDDCITGLYSQAALPAVLQACRESRQVVGPLYPHCFGSFLQPERVRFNFDLDVLCFDISQEEEGLHRLFGVLKETELARLKYVAIGEEYLEDGVVDIDSAIAELKRALRAMTGLKEMIVVRDVTIETSSFRSSRKQMKFYAEPGLGEAEPGWPVGLEEFSDVQAYAGWKTSNTMKMTGVYGWRTI